MFCKSGAGVCGSIQVGSSSQQHRLSIVSVFTAKQLWSSAAFSSLLHTEWNWKWTKLYNWTTFDIFKFLKTCLQNWNWCLFIGILFWELVSIVWGFMPAYLTYLIVMSCLNRNTYTYYTCSSSQSDHKPYNDVGLVVFVIAETSKSTKEGQK